jgi:hypothetical protein
LLRATSVGYNTSWYCLKELDAVVSNPRFLDVDPRGLRLPTTRLSGADPVKLTRQLARHGTSTQGMPPLWVVRGKYGELQIYDGVTRATRVAKFLPGQTVTVEVIDDDPRQDFSQLPTVGDCLP